jgi:hypothetical protein
MLVWMTPDSTFADVRAAILTEKDRKSADNKEPPKVATPSPATGATPSTSATAMSATTTTPSTNNEWACDEFVLYTGSERSGVPVSDDTKLSAREIKAESTIFAQFRIPITLRVHINALGMSPQIPSCICVFSDGMDDGRQYIGVTMFPIGYHT